MELEPTPYQVGDRTFTGYLADGSGARPVPGILVAHEGPGLTEHTKQSARRLGGLGYVALALDLFGEPGLSLERARELNRELRADPAALEARSRAALEVLAAHPHVDAERLGAVGYCFGGAAMLELARAGAEVACVVGFHPGLDLTAAGDVTAIRGRVLVCVGEKDPIVDREQRDAFTARMAASEVDWQMIVYGGVGHSFTNPEIDAYGWEHFRYDPVADRRSWVAMRNLFDEVFAPGDRP